MTESKMTESLDDSFLLPVDFAPVCTRAFAKLKPEFDKRSANDLSSHDKCVDDIDEVSNTNLQFPIIADADQDLENIAVKGIAFTIRSVLVSRIFLEGLMTMMYPASTGRNSTDVLRVIDSLQSGDKEGVVTPIDWQVGEDVIVPPSVSTEDAKKKFGDVREVKPYLRFTKA
ncbi:thioredoxin-like protein [Fusarium oxysporum Fo47]|uniref:thioredoxin-like protein n=1 Tax=Fusarium oxysporum Fo47 TaxID=660027 RepID=UPI0028699CA6|nr:thioredoxin-like protein [Fusarium oxysporum Fo47]QKD56542.2 thioredoxin-like protein [Fusarium oxysporum Fo47]